MQNPLISTTSKMQLCSFQQPQFSLPTNKLDQLQLQRLCLFGRFNKFLNSKTYPCCRKVQFSHITAQLSPGVTRFSSSAVVAIKGSVDVKDEDTVFVAGATGRVGSRTVRELLKMGFKVRAGVRSAQRAESLVQSVREMKLDSSTLDENGVKPIEKLKIVECDLERRGQILPALANASVVICCIGASEKEVFDVTGPYRIDYQSTKNLIDAATDAKVKHFILLTSLGTNKVGFPAAILNLFWGVLIWKRKAEEALIESGLPYTIVRPGGMERPTDSYKETHNIVLSQEDTLFGGQVSNLQVAELMAYMAQNRNLSYCKVVEVVAETTAPLTPMDKLLVKIPSNRENPYEAEGKEIATADAKPVKSDIPEPDAGTFESAAVNCDIATAATSDIPASLPEPDADTFDSAAVTSQKLQPLSPYTVYEDLKPPSSPSPSQPRKDRDESVKTSKVVDATSDIPTTVPGPDADTNDSAAVASQKPQPLSPYTVYEDLKPPSSPSPSQPRKDRDESVETSKAVDATSDIPTTSPGSVADTFDSAAVKSQKSQPLSPYTVYEDLKPPSSPSPSQPRRDHDESMKTSKAVDGVPVIIDGILAQNDPRESTFYHSPFPVYEDLRPPTSPTPMAPNSFPKTLTLPESQDPAASVSSVEDVAEPLNIKVTIEEQNPIEPKPRPLSPYTMYYDMKPPSSPMPPPPKNH